MATMDDLKGMATGAAQTAAKTAKAPPTPSRRARENTEKYSEEASRTPFPKMPPKNRILLHSRGACRFYQKIFKTT